MRGIYKCTADLLPTVEKYLRGGKTLKEISYLIDRSLEATWKIARRNPVIQQTLLETHDLRMQSPRYYTSKVLLKAKAL